MTDVRSFLKNRLSRISAFIAVFILLSATPSIAMNVDLFGSTLRVMGYMNQSVQWGVAGDHYDTKDNFQAAITQILAEFHYEQGQNFTLFASANLNMDWSYHLIDGGQWDRKGFDNAKDDLFFLDENWTLLKEAHATFATGNVVWRLGKQIVSWGEMDGVRVMDQINPQDLRRGISDVQFETTIIPLWLAKCEYVPGWTPSWMQTLAFEATFNPNAQFIPSQSGDAANHVAGIWAYNIVLPGNLRYGTQHANSTIEKPETWDSDGFEYGLRVKAYIDDAIITLGYFDGVANDPAVNVINMIPASVQNDPANFILDPVVNGKYADQRYAGMTFTRDINTLKIGPLGGVAPVLRVEALYGFDATYGTAGKVVTGNPLYDPFLQGLEEHDEIKAGIALDYKVKIPFLNPRENFSISPQYILHRILDYPENYQLAQSVLTYEEDNHVASLMIRTSYLHAKLVPLVFFQHYWKKGIQYDVGIAKLSYEQNNTWNYTLAYTYVAGDSVGEFYGNKDNVSFTVSCRF